LPPGWEDHKELRELYTEHVARRELEKPLGIVLSWLEACTAVYGIDLAAPGNEPEGELH
jgi:hypothetical protein